MARSEAATVHPEHAQHEPTSFWRRYVFSTDHKVIAIQYLVTSFAMAAVGGLLAFLMRIQLGWPDRRWPLLEAIMPNAFRGGQMNPDFYYGLVTMHGTVMVFFFLTTGLSGGFANFLIPLQIGARDMAFPVLNMISYWLFPVSILFAVASFFVDGGAPGTGWTAYPPLSTREPLGQTLWLISVFI
ncbi:MAG TPA: cbb3-type cytochrome c oxidase subunit I, partial [Bacillota bacterium]